MVATNRIGTEMAVDTTIKSCGSSFLSDPHGPLTD